MVTGITSRLLSRLSWFCLLALCGLPLVFPPALEKIGWLTVSADDGIRTPQWTFFWVVAAAGLAACWASSGLAWLRHSPLRAPLLAMAGAAVVLPLTAFRVSTAVADSLGVLAGIAAACLAARWLGDARRLRILGWLVLVVNLLVTLYGLMQYLGFDNMRWAYAFGGQRPHATLGNPNFMAGHFATLVPWAAAMFLGSRLQVEKAVWFFISIVWLWLILISQTRGAWIATAAALAWLGWTYWKYQRPLLTAQRGWLTAVAILAVLTGVGTAIKNADLAARMGDFGSFGQFAKRYAAAEVALLIWREHPLTGVGPGCFKHGFGKYMARVMPVSEEKQFVHTFAESRVHCDFLQILSETGVVGFGIFAWLVFAAIRTLLRAARSAPHISYALLAGGIGLAVHGTFNFPLDIAPTAMLFWLGIGVAARPADRAEMVERRLLVPRRPAVRPMAFLGALVVGLLGGLILLASFYTRSGKMLRDLRLWRPAHLEYRKGMVVDWDDRREAFYAAATLFQSGKHLESVALFEQEIAQNPYYMDGHTNLGSALGIIGNVEGAERAIRRAIELNPAYAEAYRNLGVALLSTDRFTEAVEVFRRSLELDPANTLGQNGLRQALAEIEESR